MYVTGKENISQINFLASAKVQAFTTQVDDTGVTANAKGRKVIPAGTVYPANDGTAEGIIYNDVDVTEGPQPASLIVEAYIINERLPEEVSPEAAAAMKEIKYRYGKPDAVSGE